MSENIPISDVCTPKEKDFPSIRKHEPSSYVAIKEIAK